MEKVKLMDAKPKKMYMSGMKAKKAFCMGELVWSCGNVVTYIVDDGISYQEEVDEGVSCLSPTTFTPAISGWTFVGWRQDNTASGSVLSSLVMGDDPITLYAVFQQAVTVSYAGNGSTGGSTAAQSDYRYYNNGDILNPSFTLEENGFTKTNHNFSKWAMETPSGTQYSAGENVMLSASTTFYAVWTPQTVEITFVEAGASTKANYNKGSTVNRATAPSGAAFVGWSTSADGTSPAKTFAATSNMTMYRVIKYNDYVIENRYVENGVNEGTRGIAYTVDVAKYPTLRLSTTSTRTADFNAMLRYSEGGNAGDEMLKVGLNGSGTCPAQSRFYLDVYCQEMGYAKVEGIGKQAVG